MVGASNLLAPESDRIGGHVGARLNVNLAATVGFTAGRQWTGPAADTMPPMRWFLRSLAISSIALLASCVSQQKYDELELDANHLREENGRQAAKLKELEGTLAERTSLVNELQTKYGKASSRSAELDRSLAETKQALDELSRRKAEVEQQLRDFRNVSASLKSLIDTGAIQVRFVKGRMVVTMGSDVLFKSGSAALSPEGKAAVRDVSQQLARLEGKDFQVEGHTDNVPIKTAEFPSNWSLASARALRVVDTMIAAGMPADRVSAASYADTRPAAANDSAEARAKNRRIDIVVVPDLSKLLVIGEERKGQDRSPAAERP